MMLLYGIEEDGGAAYSLASILGEEVRRDESAGDALIQARPAVVGRVDDGVLEAARVLEVEVQLAVLGVVGGLGARADVGLELVEAVGDDLGVIVNIYYAATFVLGEVMELLTPLSAGRAIGGHVVWRGTKSSLRSCPATCWSRRSLADSRCPSRSCRGW